MQEMKEEYLIVTYIDYEGADLSFYNTYEEALEDFDPVNWHQELYKVQKIIP